jgi:hypothetical protein
MSIFILCLPDIKRKTETHTQKCPNCGGGDILVPAKGSPAQPKMARIAYLTVHLSNDRG